MNDPLGIITIIISIGALIVTTAFNRHSTSRDVIHDVRAEDKRFNDLRDELKNDLDRFKLEVEHRLTENEIKIELFWRKFEKKMAEDLHSPHTPEADRLLEKLSAGSINIQERMCLGNILQNNVKNKVYSSEKEVKAIFLATYLCLENDC